ncbi:hypothetical protein C2E23DRAFT_907242 [Lenzites betulinus]|nr:hypothetical protein C2E23DRAFT_907242 [Lenzites betulinus]
MIISALAYFNLTMMLEDQDHFTVPKAVFITPHIVHSNDAWPAPASEYAASLCALARGASLMQIDGEDRVQAAVLAAVQCSAEIQDRLRVEAAHPYLGPENKRSILGKIVGRIMQELTPEVATNYETVYARAVHSCYSNFSAVRILPSRGRADCVVSLPVSLSETLSPPPPPAAGEESRPSTEAIPVDAPSLQHHGNAHSGSYGYGVWVTPDDERHPFSHAQLLLPQRPDDLIPFPIICVASHDNIYELLSSALFQRRTFGVEDPVLGFTFDSLDCRIQVVVAWLSECTVDSHECVQVNVAHASPRNMAAHDYGECSALALGIFDVSAAADASALASLLLYHRLALASCAYRAQLRAPGVGRTLLSEAIRPWRLDLVAKFGLDEGAPSTNSRIREWLAGECGPCVERKSPSSSQMSCPPPTTPTAIEILGDRYYHPAVYTPIRPPTSLETPWPDAGKCEEIRQKYILPALLDYPADLIRKTHSEGDFKMVSYDGSNLSTAHCQRLPYSALSHEDCEALVELVNSNTIEQALRQVDSSVPPLPGLSEEAAKILVRATREIRRASDDMGKKLREYNEAEVRAAWDKLIRGVVNACPAVSQRWLDVLSERVAPMSRNDLADELALAGIGRHMGCIRGHSMHIFPAAIYSLLDQLSSNTLPTSVQAETSSAQVSLEDRLKRSLALSEQRSYTAVDDMSVALRTLQTQYENETWDADAARARKLRCFVHGSKFDLCIAWSFRDFFPAHYTGKDKQDEIDSY